MSLAAVVFAHAVAIHAPGADSAQLEAAVEGCNQALGADRCASSPESADAEWAATITWTDDAYHVAHVQLIRKGSETLESVTRDVEFGGSDPLKQRFRAVGLIIAAYVIASGRADAVETPKPPGAQPLEEPSDRTLERPPPPAPIEARSGIDDGWGIDGAALLGSSFRGVPLAVGATLKPWARLKNTPWIALGQLRLRHRDTSVRSDWFSGSLGLGLHIDLPSTPLGLELRSEAVLEYVALLAEDTAASRRERAGLWRIGGRAGADVVFGLTTDLALFLGGDLTLTGRNVAVDVAGAPAGRESALSAAGLVGLRFRAK